MKANSFFALLTGLAAGAVLGLLFAPESGEKSREKIKKAADDCLSKVKAKWEEELDDEEEEEEEEVTEPETPENE
ncbi:MAG: YtxH domain-containing protein [Bacteroidales bacterium]|nr:YtxH domain-containing protein [Bacteroidales bacterium]MBR1782633.1 YtxH domain-containing protein [Bacteroidales bacterium]